MQKIVAPDVDPGMTQRTRSALHLVGILLGLGCKLVGCAADAPSNGIGGLTPELQHVDEPRPVPLVVDADMGFDDAAALAYLCEQHHRGSVELRAVTVANNGIGLPGKAIRHARCVLQACGLLDVPVAEGASLAVHAVPPELQAAMDSVLTATFTRCEADSSAFEVDAPALIRRAVEEVESAWIITLGPLTNLAEALAGAPELGEHVEAVVTMGGAFDVPGNLFGAPLEHFDNTQETNIWVDPGAAQRVLRALPPNTLRLIPLDATQQVPVTTAFASELEAEDTSASAELVRTMLQQPAIEQAIGTGQLYWWDVLAVVASVADDVATFESARVAVLQHGDDAGRTVRGFGRPAAIALGADATRFEEAFIAGLRGIERSEAGDLDAP